MYDKLFFSILSRLLPPQHVRYNIVINIVMSKSEVFVVLFFFSEVFVVSAVWLEIRCMTQSHVLTTADAATTTLCALLLLFFGHRNRWAGMACNVNHQNVQIAHFQTTHLCTRQNRHKENWCRFVWSPWLLPDQRVSTVCWNVLFIGHCIRTILLSRDMIVLSFNHFKRWTMTDTNEPLCISVWVNVFLHVATMRTRRPRIFMFYICNRSNK